MTSKVTRLRRRTAAVAAAMTGALLLAACGGSDGGNAAGGKNDSDATLRIMYGMAASLNPADAPEPAQLTFSTWPAYDRLIRVGGDSSYQPMLATSWEFAKDGMSLKLKLRDDVTFTDGEKFDAEVVKANIEFFKKAEKSAVANNLATVARVEVTGDHEVVVHLTRPSTEIVSTFASNLGGIMVSPKALASGDLATKPVGTGAYKLESFKPGEQAVYVRRTDKGGIWDPKTGNVAKVVVSRIAGPDAKVNALKSGQIDLTTWTGDRDFEGNNKLQTVVLKGALNMTGVYLNPKIKPLDDVKVRQAINLAVDRASIVKAFSSTSVARVQPWPEGLTGFEKSREGAYSYDPAKAKELLAEAGYADGFTLPGDFLTSPSAGFDKVAESVQANLAEVGIKINLRTMDILSQIGAYAGGKNPGQVQYMSLPSIDPYSWLQRLYINPVWNPAGATPELVGLTQGVDDPRITDDERTKKVEAAVAYATENALFAPLWQGVGGLAASTKVKGLDEVASINGGVADLRYLSMTK